MRKYKATYVYEVEFLAVDDEDAMVQWMDIDVDNLQFELTSDESAVIGMDFSPTEEVTVNFVCDLE